MYFSESEYCSMNKKYMKRGTKTIRNFYLMMLESTITMIQKRYIFTVQRTEAKGVRLNKRKERRVKLI